MFLLAAGAVSAYAADDLASLTADATKLASTHEKVLERLKENLTVKRANEEKIKKIEREDAQLQVLSSKIEAQRPTVDSLCNRTVPSEQYPAALAQCKAVQDPFNADVGAYNSRSAVNEQQRTNVNQDELARVAEAEGIVKQAKEIEARLEVVRKAINAHLGQMGTKCLQDTGGGSNKPEVAAYALQKCWDRAVSGLPPVEQTTQYKMQFGGRTPQQAIEEYRKSGRQNPGPARRTTTEPPPPKQ
jgi:hypothetical protein